VRRAGDARIEVLAPCPRFDAGWDPNDNSLVLRVTLGRRALLFAGDAEAHEEAVLAAGGAALAADVLKVAHHGSRTSSTTASATRTRRRSHASRRPARASHASTRRAA
jgi:competence protein ComEC